MPYNIPDYTMSLQDMESELKKTQQSARSAASTTMSCKVQTTTTTAFNKTQTTQQCHLVTFPDHFTLDYVLLM